MSLTQFLRKLTRPFGTEPQRRRRSDRLVYDSRRTQISPTAASLETLEDRTLLAAVVWDGDAGDFQWTNPLNWDGDVLPGTADDVTIDVPGSQIDVELAGAAAVNSIVNQESLSLVNGTLTIYSASVNVGDFSATGTSTVTVSGTGASLAISGTATLETTNLFAAGGGILRFSGAASYTGAQYYRNTIRADGEGSRIVFDNLPTFIGGVSGDRYGAFDVDVEARNGGEVDLSSSSAVAEQINFAASGQDGSGNPSRIDISGITDLPGLQNLAVHNTGVLNAPNITTVNAATLQAYGGGQLVLPAVTSYTRTGWNTRNEIRADGEGSIVDLPNIASIDGGVGGDRYGLFDLDIVAANGGEVGLTNTTEAALDTPLTLANQINFSISGADSLGNASRIDLRDVTELPGLQNLAVHNTGVLNAPNITTVNAATLQAYGGGQLVLPAVTSYTRTGWNTRNEIRADGEGSFVDLPNIASIDGGVGGDRYGLFDLDIVAANGGEVGLTNTTEAALDTPLTLANQINFSIHGADSLGNGSRINLRDVTELPGLQNITVYNTGVLNTPNIATVNAATLRAYDGGQLLLPSVTTYTRTGFNTRNEIRADGEGSLVDLSNITSIDGGVGGDRYGLFDLDIVVASGGEIRLTNLSEAPLDTPLALTSQINISVQGADSQANGSRLDLRDVTDLPGAQSISVAGPAEVNVSNIASINDTQLYASGGGQLLLPSATTYSGAANSRMHIQASGLGSRIELPSLSEIVGGTGTVCCSQASDVRIQAIDGAVVDISGATQVTRQVTISATGANSLVDLSSVTTMDGSSPAFPHDPVSVTISDGGSVLLPSVTTLRGVSLYANDGLTLDVSSATSYEGVNARTSIRATGAGSRVLLPNVTSIDGAVGTQCCTQANQVRVQAIDGGFVDLSGASQITDQSLISATGANSVVDFSAVTIMDGSAPAFPHDPISVTVSDQGSVLLPSVTTLRGVSLFANDGLTLELPAATTYEGTNAHTYLRATGTGSRISLPNLTTIDGATGTQCCTQANQVRIQAIDGGMIDIPSLNAVTGSTTAVIGENSALRVTGGTATLAIPIDVQSNGVLEGGVLELGSNGILSGSGTVDGNLRNISGHIRPGSSPGDLTINGDFENLPGGTVDVELGGLVPGTEHDRLNILGTATLAGTLNVSLINGFSPADGDEFEVLTFASRTGDFDTKNGLDLPGNQVLFTNYGPGNMVLGAIGDDPPVIASLSASPDPVLQSADLMLTANGVDDPNVNVAAVHFYRDVDGNGLLDTNVDELYGSDADGTDGWTITAPATFSSGTHTFLAQAEDTTDNFSNVVSAIVDVAPAVYWDGGGGDFSWHNAQNWSGDVVPQSTDDVVINITGEITVTHPYWHTTIGSLHSYESLILAGGSLTVTGASEISGTLSTGTNATLSANGPHAVLLATGPVDLGVSNLFATNGGTIDLPAAAAYSSPGDGGTSLRAHGAGSQLLLRGMTSLYGYGRHGQLLIEARGGGLVDLSSLTEIPQGTTQIQSLDADSVVDVSSLTSWTDNNRQRSSFVRWGDGGAVRVNVLDTLTSVGITADTGDVLSFPSLTHIGGIGDSSATIIANGVGSQIEMPGVLTMDGPDRHGQLNIQARDGGAIDLSGLVTNLNGTTVITAFDTGSQIDLSSLQSWTDNNRQRGSLLTWGDGGTVSVDSLQTINSVSLTAENGNVLSFPALERIGGVGDSSADIMADGAGSRLEFPSVTAADGPERHGSVTFRAENGGVVSLSVLTEIQHGSVNVSAFDSDASGSGSIVSMPSLVSWNNNNDNRQSYLRYGRSGHADLSALTTLIGVSIYATDGDTVRLPALNAYDRGFNVQSTIQATGPGSRVELPIATAIRYSTNRGGIWIRAYDGGVVSIPEVTSITGGPTNISVRGNGSKLEINNLQQWSIGGTQWMPSQLLVEDGGIAVADGDLSIHSIPIHVRTQGAISVPKLELLSGASLDGDGTIDGDLLNTAGHIRPGNTIGILTVTGNFENSANGQVTVELGGTQAVTDYDTVQVLGTAILDGRLNVSLTNGFTPAIGDSFQILQFDSRVCDFLTKNGLDLGGGLYLAAAFDLTSMTLNAGMTPDSGQQCQTIPVLTNVDVGPDPAKIGDDLSVTFEVDVALLNTPQVTVAGNAATLASQNGSLYTFTYTVAGTEPEGFVDVVMTATSLDGGVGTETVSTELDFTAPVITAITPDQIPADVGTVLTITFNASEALNNSTEVLIGGQPANRISPTTYTRLLTGDEGLGQVTVEVAAVDLAGNTSSTTEQVLIVSGGFDVNVTGIDLSDDHPAVGQTVTASSQIHNSGLYDVSNVPVRLTLIEPDGDEILLSETVVPLIAAGSTAAVATDIDLATGGVHVFRLQVDPDNLIPEIRELDNVATRSLIVDSAESTVIDVSGSLSLTSVVPGADVTVSGSASWLAGLNPAGAVAGGLVSLSVPGTFISGTAFTNSNGEFSLLFDAPVVPGDYVANVTVSDVTTQSLLALPFTVTAPVGGIDFFTNDARIGASDVTPVINTSVTLNARVHNVGGDDFTSATNVRFYDGGTLISTQPITGLASQASTVVSFSHTFTSAGPHVITAVVDEDNLTVENNESNNAGSRTITVLDNVPDLSPIDILFSDLTPATTDTVTITARVLNDGGAGATDVVVRFFDGTNALGAAVIPAVAADGGTEFVSIQAVLPPAGQHDISVVVDPEGAIAETDETNNLRIESILVHDPAPDLVASVIGLSDPTPVAGDTIDVSMTISNRGELAAGAFDAAFFKDGTSFGTVRVPGLAAGSTTVVTLSTSFSTVGAHAVSILLDAAEEIIELSESNNTASRGLQVLATPLSDLRINGAEIALSDPNPGAGETVTVTVPIRNIGHATANGVTAELRIDGVIAGSAASSPADIPAGQSGDWTFDFVAPAGDGFHLLEIVVDQDNLIGESNENNNRDFLQFLVGDHPDLVPSGITFSNAGPVEGDVITISATVTNDGDAAVGEFLVRVLDGSQPIGEVTVAGLAVGGSEVISIPFDTTGRTGLRLIQVIADPGNLITEFNEGDNLITRNLTVTAADAVAPTTVATASVAANAAGWNNTNVDVVLSATDNTGGSGVAYLRYSVDGGPLQQTFGDTQTIAFSAEGIHNIAWQAVDFAQNTESLQTLTVRIDKTAPVAVHGGAYSVDEGDSITLDGTGSTDTLSGIADIQWALDGDGLYDDGATPEYVAPDGPLNVPVRLRVLDAAGNEAIVATEIVVANIAPTAHAGGNVDVSEGGTRVLDASGSSDPGDDIVSYLWDLDGDNVFGETGVNATLGDEVGLSPEFDASLLDGPDSRTVKLRVTDSFGAVGENTVTVSVTNVVPAFEAGPNENLVPADSGVFSRTNVAFTDPGLADVHTVTVNFGDNTGDQTVTLASGARSFDLGHTYSTEGQFVVNVTVSDDDDDVATDSFVVDVVLNTAPEAATDSDPAANEVAEAAATGKAVGVTADAFDADGDTLTYSLDDSAGGRFRIDASSGVVTVDDGSLLDGPDLHVITVRATDPLAEFSTADFTITVLNVVPTAAAGTASVTVDEGSTAVNSGTFGDVGADTVAVTASIGTVTQNDVAGTWSWSWDTSDGPDDSQTVTITATDSDGAATATTFALTVTNEAPTVAADNATITVAEGSTAGNSGVFGDVGDDTVVITASIGTVTQNDVAGTWSWSWDTSDGPDDSQTVTITATDSDGAATATTFALTVTNEAPTVAADNATITAAEGSTAGNSGTFGDVGDDTVVVTASIGTVTQNDVAGTWSWS
ncbi:MAG: CARDB domain-containing protein, partial [Fuerstiella sp.]